MKPPPSLSLRHWPASVSSGGISGTPAYMSPEQWKGEAATAASDVFAFGLIFFELMTGRRALSADRLADVVAQVQNPQFAAALAEHLPEPFRELLIAVLATNPASRPTAAGVRRLLESGRAVAPGVE